MSLGDKAPVNRRVAITLLTLTVAILLHWYLNLPRALAEPWITPRWRYELGPLIAGLSAVLPGALVGLVAGRYGIVLGAVVGYVGHVLGAAPLELEDRTASSIRLQILGAALEPLGHAVLSAAGGGAGQLLRSNNMPQRSRGE